MASALRICRALCRFDEGQSGRWYAGFQKSFTIVGDVSRIFPMEIPQVPLDGQAGIVGQQDFGRPSRLLAPPQLGERRGPQRQHLKMIGIGIQRLARPRQRGIILPQQIVAERVRRRKLIPGIAVATLCSHREQLDGLPMLAAHEVAHAENAAGPQCRTSLARLPVSMRPSQPRNVLPSRADTTESEMRRTSEGRAERCFPPGSSRWSTIRACSLSIQTGYPES